MSIDTSLTIELVTTLLETATSAALEKIKDDIARAKAMCEADLEMANREMNASISRGKTFRAEIDALCQLEAAIDDRIRAKQKARGPDKKPRKRRSSAEETENAITRLDEAIAAS